MTRTKGSRTSSKRAAVTLNRAASASALAKVRFATTSPPTRAPRRAPTTPCAAPAAGAELIDRALEGIERRFDASVLDVLARGLREARMDGGRLGMRDRMA